MRTPVTLALPTAMVIALLSGLGGCQRAPEVSSEPAAQTPSAPAEPTAPTIEPGAGTAASEGVLQAYVWTCDDGQTIRMRNLLRENAITIELHEGGRKLPLVVSASGARYSDGSLTFWTKGDTALFERPGSAPVNCRQDRFESLLADARVRGLAFRGTGNEPGWTVEIGPGARLDGRDRAGRSTGVHHELRPGSPRVRCCDGKRRRWRARLRCRRRRAVDQGHGERGSLHRRHVGAGVRPQHGRGIRWPSLPRLRHGPALTLGAGHRVSPPAAESARRRPARGQTARRASRI